MVHLRSRPPQPPGPALNAIATPLPDDREQRRARQVIRCERLAELGMELVESAHREAQRECQAPPVRRTPWPNLSVLPDPPSYRSTVFSELFIELSGCVRRAVLLQSRIDAGAYDHPRHYTATAPHEAPARAVASPGPRPSSDETRLGYERVEDDLAGDLHRSAPEILDGIADKLDAVMSAAPELSRPAPETSRQRAPATTPQNSPPERPLTAVERSARLAAKCLAPPRATSPPNPRKLTPLG